MKKIKLRDVTKVYPINKDLLFSMYRNIQYFYIIDHERYYIQFYNGNQYWYKNGSLHREMAPAIMTNDGKQFYCLEGKLRRTQNEV